MVTESLFLGWDKLDAVYEVSGVLEGNKSRYGVKHLLDGAHETAWAVKGGVGATVTVWPSSREKVRGMFIVEGYAKSKALWGANNRIATLHILVEARGTRRSYRVTFPDDPDFQAYDNQMGGGHYITFPEPLQPDRLILTVERVHRGGKYDDLCVSALEFVTGLEIEKDNQPEEIDRGLFSGAGPISDKQGHLYMANIKHLILGKNWEGLARHVRYPITVSIDAKKKNIKNIEEFIQLAPRIFSTGFTERILAASLSELFCNYQGIMLGNGEIWIGHFDDIPGSGLRVKAINN
jgi:hypothetical protein